MSRVTLRTPYSRGSDENQTSFALLHQGWDFRIQFTTIAFVLLNDAGKHGAHCISYGYYGYKVIWQEMHTESMIVIDQHEDGSRIDRVLIRRLGAGRRSLILRLIRKGNVRVNKKRVKPEMRLAKGDQVFLPTSLRGEGQQGDGDFSEKHAGGHIPTSLLHIAERIEVLYEDDHLLLINKPAGTVVHGGSGHGAGLIEALKVVRELPDLRLAHRLDRDTSGLLLMAKELSSLRILSSSFREREMQKSYFALVSGHPFAHAGRMRSHLNKGQVRGGERMVVNQEEGKEAITDYQVVMAFQQGETPYALLALHPHSGRTHQLRVQLQQEGHAILGDAKYAEKEDLKAYRNLKGKGLMLHAWRLRFHHPVTKKPLEFRASWPDTWQHLLRPSS